MAETPTGKDASSQSANPASAFYFDTAMRSEWLTTKSGAPHNSGMQSFALWDAPTPPPPGPIVHQIGSFSTNDSHHREAQRCYALTILDVLAKNKQFAAGLSAEEKSKLTLTLDRKVATFSDAPWCNTASSLPDICLAFNGAALVCFEVASGQKELRDVCAQLFVVVAEQLRVLKEAGSDVTACVGYALPQQGNPIPFGEVKASWNEAKMKIQLDCTEITNSNGELREAFETTLSKCLKDQINPQLEFWRNNKPQPVMHIYKLHQDELTSLASVLKVPDGKTLEQLPSRDSMVFKTSDATLFWKLSNTHDNKMRHLKRKAALHHIVVMHTDTVERVDRFLLEYPGHQQLHRSDVRKNPALFWEIVQTLSKLHEAGYAHLDVRFQNMVFSTNQQQQQVLLIDLDRSLEATENVGALRDRYAPTIWYGYQADGEPDIFRDWTAEQLDWFQLALVLLGIPPNSKKVLGMEELTGIVNGIKHEQTKEVLQKLLKGNKPTRSDSCELDFSLPPFPLPATAIDDPTKQSTPIKSKLDIQPQDIDPTATTTTTTTTPVRPQQPEFATPTHKDRSRHHSHVVCDDHSDNPQQNQAESAAHDQSTDALTRPAKRARVDATDNNNNHNDGNNNDHNDGNNNDHNDDHNKKNAS